MRHIWLVPILALALGGGLLARALAAQQAAPTPAPPVAPASEQGKPASSSASTTTLPAKTPSATPDPTRPDDRLRHYLKPVATAQPTASLGSVALRGLVVSAQGEASAIVAIGGRLEHVTRDSVFAFDPSGLRLARTVSLDAQGLVLEDVTTGERIRLN